MIYSIMCIRLQVSFFIVCNIHILIISHFVLNPPQPSLSGQIFSFVVRSGRLAGPTHQPTFRLTDRLTNQSTKQGESRQVSRYQMCDAHTEKIDWMTDDADDKTNLTT